MGVEGTGSYGAGLARYLAAAGVQVLEVIRPDRQRRRRRGKSDVVDAVSAAIAALRGRTAARPRAATGPPNRSGRCGSPALGAMKARTQAGNQLRDLITTAPDLLRAQLQGLSTPQRVRAAAAFTCGDAADPAEGAEAAMASVAARWLELDAEVTRLETVLDDLFARVAAPGVPRLVRGRAPVRGRLDRRGPRQPWPDHQRGRAYAALCGVSPVDCSSGKQERHRLNRGGDRQANSALWRIAVTRIEHDPRTQEYYARRIAAGKTRKEVIRELKRYIAREAYRKLIRPGFLHHRHTA